MKAGRSRDGVGGVVQADLAVALGPADLAPDLVALLLAQGGEVVVHGAAHGQLRHGADVLAFHVERPALRHLAGAEGSGQRIGRRVAAAEAAEVHGVPRIGVLRVPRRAAVRSQRLGHGRQVLGRGEQRGVVRVVRGAEEDRLRVRRDGGQLRAAGVADRGVQLHVGGLHLVAVHEGRDGHGRGVVGRVGRDQDHGLLVGVGAVPVPPGAMERPAREGRCPGVRVHERVPGRGIHVVERAADGPQGSGPGLRRRRVTVGRRTGRFAGQGFVGHACEDSWAERG